MVDEWKITQSPSFWLEILFTNKAKNEMRLKIDRMTVNNCGLPQLAEEQEVSPPLSLRLESLYLMRKWDETGHIYWTLQAAQRR